MMHGHLNVKVVNAFSNTISRTWYNIFFFYVLLTVHLSIFISVNNQLDAQNFCFTIILFHASTCFEHHVLIIRRSKLHYTASGIITTVGDRHVHRLRDVYRT